jgi:predicted methyltransferase
MRGMMMGVVLGGAILAAAPAAAQAARQSAEELATGGAVKAAMEGAWRTEAEKARDKYRNPAQTLAFFGLRRNMTVIEVNPSGGWYSAILAPALRERGKYIAALPDPATSEGAKRSVDAWRARFADAAVFGTPQVVVFNRATAANFAAPGSADMVLTFRNVHNWVGAGFAPDAFKGFLAALKPGGILGVVEHRLPADRAETEATAKSGYMKESAVIALAEAAGFELVGRSEVNANPKDTADHANGVWALPPNLRGGDVDREKFVAIGESDRMTLRFRKPVRNAAR